MEIVSEPDLRSAEEAGIYVRKLRSILRYLGTCDGNMEEGSLRCDCNVSVRRPGEPLGTRCEIKNLNSVRFVMQAIHQEARRQIDVLENGGAIKQETRLYDTERGETRPMRSKEDAHDYRYFPDPDLLPLVLDEAWVEKLRAQLPELPDAKKARFVSQYGLRAEDAGVLVAERATAEFFEAVARGRDAKTAAYWVIGDLFGALNKKGLGIEQSPVAADQLGGLIDLIADGTISGRIAKDVFAEMIETGVDAAAIVEQKGLRQLSDTGAIQAAVDAALAAHPAQVAQYATNPKVLGFFIGQVMKATQGKANPALVNELLRKKLAG
jgi:aspartyl-tRNA(Asn)/glutamyl-tRNA(Gln) amidotransferase subunit B